MSPRHGAAHSRVRARPCALRSAASLLVLASALLALGAAGSCPAEPGPGEPLRGLDREQLARFQAGRAVFSQAFTPEQGLGPLFNADACAECHEDPVPGGAGDETETHVAVPLAGGGCDLLAERGGPVFQAHATPALVAALGDTSEPLPPGVVERATRSSPDLFGMGLLDAVPESEILEREDPADRDHDGISGRANRAPDGRLGRFGRKALAPSLDEFNAGAFVIEMGITNPRVPAEETVGGRPVPPSADPATDPELGAEALGLAMDFVRFLAPPAPERLSPRGQTGRALFTHMGCASCHRPALRTGPSRVRALDRQWVHAYSDLLLHDLGAEQGDICMGLATASEFRTEPLMGLRFARRFMHDGAAATPEAAIERHGGEGARARAAFRRASATERAALLEFLRSL